MPDARPALLSAVDLARLSGVLEDAARDAGKLAHSMLSSNLKSWTKNGSSPVSEADIAANELIRNRLRATAPGFGWLSEENEDDSTRLSKRFTWIVDPIDGTRAFIAGREDWCVSIALVDGDAPLLASVYAPVTNEMFLATRGQGAFLNGVRLQASGGVIFEMSRMAGPKYLVERLIANTEVAPHPRIGSLALRLCRIADGSLDIAFAGGNSRDWDIAAADLIVTEAGGKLTSLVGDVIRYNRREVTHDTLVAAGRERHAHVVARFGGDAR